MTRVYLSCLLLMLTAGAVFTQTPPKPDSDFDRIRLWNPNVNYYDYPQSSEACSFCMTDPHPLLGQYAGKDVWRPVFNDPKKLFRPLVNISPTIRMVNNGSWTTINSFTHILNNGKTRGGSARGGHFILSSAKITRLAGFRRGI